ncbi:MAG: helix-turn-helix domain-containing protein [Clostridiales bacterium]|nr:helix-turn-helix domain-containing protein [Clostridiales bacterium]
MAQETEAENNYYQQVQSLVNHGINPCEFLRDAYYNQMSEAVYKHWLSSIAQASPYKDIVSAACSAYDDLHKMSIFLEMMHIDEFDNFLVFMIAGRFIKELSGFKAMAGVNEYDFSEQVADRVWESCRKSDSYMIKLERDIAKIMSNAIKLRFYGQETQKIDDIVKFIVEYYRVDDIDESEKKREEGGANPLENQEGKAFSLYFCQLRRKRKDELTLTEMSNRCSISKSMIDSFLKGEAYPKRDTVFKLAFGLKLSQQELNEMMEALDKDLGGRRGIKSCKINKADHRDMLLYTELPNRLPLEEINFKLLQRRMKPLEQQNSTATKSIV